MAKIDGCITLDKANGFVAIDHHARWAGIRAEPKGKLDPALAIPPLPREKKS